MASLPAIYGAILLGGFIASGLSGIITAQTFTYIKQYPSDTHITKLIVALTWFVSLLLCFLQKVQYSILFRILDSIHTGLVCTTSWIFMVQWFGDESKI
ncbi:hypothetical protein BDR04DRAFT_894014, partial [Suillus decipiens]